MTAETYLSHAYALPEKWPALPLPEEAFVSSWQEGEGQETLDFLAEGLKLPAQGKTWENLPGLSISFAGTLAGRLPVIATGSHQDFRQMEALLNGREKMRELPPTVNAFSMQARAESIFRHHVLLLNRAPYSNIPPERLGLTEEEWLRRSHLLRLRHECAHYETLRLLGGMQNHALDEIIADGLGQLAAFGNFSARRQRLFFGLEKGKRTCRGRLSFYCQKLGPGEQVKVYEAVEAVLEELEPELGGLLSRGAGELELFSALAGRSIADRLP